MCSFGNPERLGGGDACVRTLQSPVGVGRKYQSGAGDGRYTLFASMDYISPILWVCITVYYKISLI